VTLSSGWANLGDSQNPNDLTFGETVNFTLTEPVFSRDGFLDDCPPIMSIGNVFSDASLEAASEFTTSLTGGVLSILTTHANYAG
jgi:hypothetical protein